MTKGNLSQKAFYFFSALYLVWIGLFSLWSYQHKNSELYDFVNSHLESAALTTPLLLPEKFHHSLMSKNDLTHEQNLDLRLKLSDYAHVHDIAYIYSLVLRNGKVIFTSSNATDDEIASNTNLVEFFDEYDDVDPRVLDVFTTHEKIFIEYSDKWGSFRSVFTPQYAEDGSVYVVAADLNTSYIQGLLNKNLYQTLIISILFVLIGIPVVLAYTQNIRNLASILDERVRKKTASLTLSESKINSILEHSPVGIVHYDSNSNLVTVNKQFETMVGSSKEVLIGFNMLDSVEDQNVLSAVRRSLSGKTSHFEGPYTSVTGHKSFDVQADFVPMFSHEHDIIGGVGVFNDVTMRKHAEKELQLAARVFNDTHEGIIITDANKLIVNVNPAFSNITNYNRDEVIGLNPRILSSGRQSAEFYQDMWQQINELGHWHGEVWNRKKDGEVYAELLTVSALKDNNENIVNYLGVFSDITSSKQQQEELSLMAHYDVLTGLPNRALFSDRFTQAIAHSNRTKSLLAICFLDLDNFKPVNDNYGHDIGDQLLIEVAERIKECIREEDTVSRQGGDEFALLLGNIESYAQCEQAMKRVHHSLSQPFIINGISHQVTASSGITIYPLDESNVDTLLRHADHTMYEAKKAGRNRYHLFNAK